MADLKIAYGSSAAFTISLASLATDGNLVAGRSSAVVSNASDLYDDALIAGTIKLGSSPAAGQIEIWAWSTRDDSPTYFDNIDGTDKNASITNRNILFGFMRNVATIPTPATTGVVIPFGPVSLAGLFGGTMPQRYGVWVVHNTTVNLDSTGGNHAIKYTPVYYTAA